MKSCIVESPTRVDLAGGTLDLWPLYNFLGSAVTVNVAINIKTKVVLEERSDRKIRIDSKDLPLSEEYSDIDFFLAQKNPQLKLFQAVIEFWKPSVGFNLSAESQSPVGGGLGGSSSLTISLMKAFSQLLQRSVESIHQLVHISHNLESLVLNTPTGTQDYYPAACGGLNIIRYSASGIEQNVYPVEGSPLHKHFLLIYTGKTHHSGMNNFEVVKSAVAKDPQTMKALWELREIAEETATVCLNQSWNQLPALFNREFKSRVLLAPAFTSPEIEKLQQISMQNGAEAVKICGAGGGGCVLVWTSPELRQKVSDSCVKAGFQVMNALPVNPI